MIIEGMSVEKITPFLRFFKSSYDWAKIFTEYINRKDNMG